MILFNGMLLFIHTETIFFKTKRLGSNNVLQPCISAAKKKSASNHEQN